MYICKKHGKLKTEWCNDCREIIACDCTDKEYTRFKDLIYDCDSGEKTITLYVFHCKTCGKYSHTKI